MYDKIQILLTTTNFLLNISQYNIFLLQYKGKIIQTAVQYVICTVD